MPLLHQIGGHPDVTTDESGTLLIKPASPREIAFYQLLHSTLPCHRIPSSPPPHDPHPHAEAIRRERLLGCLKRFLPRFWGTLSVHRAPASPAQDAVVLSNLTHAYSRPCIMDIKLGTVLYDAADPGLTQEKREKMERKARERSVGVTGAAITGYQTWDEVAQRYERGERAACGVLRPDELPAAFARFTSSPQASTLRTLRALGTTLRTLHRLLASLEIRLFGSSLLIIYEGDPLLHDDAWQRVDAAGGSGDGLDEEALDEEMDDQDETSGPDDSSSWNSRPRKRSFFHSMLPSPGPPDTPSPPTSPSLPASPIPRESRPPPFTLRLIDFAHTRLCEGEGPDHGVLKGLDTVVRLVEGRIRELEEGA